MFLFEDPTFNWRSLPSQHDGETYCKVVSFLKYPQPKIKFSSVTNNLVVSDLSLQWVKVKPQSSSGPSVSAQPLGDSVSLVQIPSDRYLFVRKEKK